MLYCMVVYFLISDLLLISYIVQNSESAGKMKLWKEVTSNDALHYMYSSSLSQISNLRHLQYYLQYYVPVVH